MASRTHGLRSWLLDPDNSIERWPFDDKPDALSLFTQAALIRYAPSTSSTSFGKFCDNPESVSKCYGIAAARAIFDILYFWCISLCSSIHVCVLFFSVFRAYPLVAHRIRQALLGKCSCFLATLPVTVLFFLCVRLFIRCFVLVSSDHVTLSTTFSSGTLQLY